MLEFNNAIAKDYFTTKNETEYLNYSSDNRFPYTAFEYDRISNEMSSK